MSRVAKAPILLPANVELSVGINTVTVKGPKGTLTQHCNKLVSVTMSDSNANQVIFKPASNDPNAWAQAGTVRALVNNMVHGVTVGYDRTLELVGRIETSTPTLAAVQAILPYLFKPFRDGSN